MTQEKPTWLTLEGKALTESGLVKEGDSISDWLRLAHTETLYAADDVFTSLNFVANRLFISLLADGVSVTHDQVLQAITAAHQIQETEIRPFDFEGMEVYDWTLFATIEYELLDLLSELVGGDIYDSEVVDCHHTRKLLTRTILKTNQMLADGLRQVSGNTNALGIALSSFLQGEPTDQMVTRMLADGDPPSPVPGDEPD
jgi:hypothetical protein